MAGLGPPVRVHYVDLETSDGKTGPERQTIIGVGSSDADDRLHDPVGIGSLMHIANGGQPRRQPAFAAAIRPVESDSETLVGAVRGRRTVGDVVAGTFAVEGEHDPGRIVRAPRPPRRPAGPAPSQWQRPRRGGQSSSIPDR